MPGSKTIIVGCDMISALPMIIENIGALGNDINLITVTSISNLPELLETNTCHLVITCFKNNNLLFRNISNLLRINNTPLLCLTEGQEYLSLQWPEQIIVLADSLLNCKQSNYLTARIKSIFLLIDSNAAANQQQKLFTIDRSEPAAPSKDRELTRYLLEIEQKNAALLNIKEKIEQQLKTSDQLSYKDLRSILHSINQTVNDDKHWENFEAYFKNVNPDFISLLSSRYPSLTLRDIKYCCYIKMNMSNSEIKHLLGINQDSVRTHKYRLKKKMALAKEVDLRSYITRSLAVQEQRINYS